MNICVIGVRGIPNVSGGIETHCESLLPRLQALRAEDKITVVARRGYVKQNNYEFEGVQVVALPHMKNKYFEAATNSLIGVIYAKLFLKAKILHIHAIGPALVAPLARMLGMRVIVTHHGADYSRAKWNVIGKAALRTGEYLALNFADRIIAVSPSLAEGLRERFPRRREQVVFVPNGASNLGGVDGAVDEEGILARFGLTPDGYDIAVGRIVPEKGFHELIEAHGRAGTNRRLVIVGSALHEDNYSRSLFACASERTVLTGFMKHRQLGVLLKNAALFVMPSHHEGLPIAALEAAATGCPVLMSDIQPNKDLGLPDKHYFKVGDVEDLRRHLEQSPSDYRIDADDFLSKYDWTTISRQTNQVYSSVAKLSI